MARQTIMQSICCLLLISAMPLLKIEASLAQELSVEDRTCITSAVAKLPQAAALKIEGNRNGFVVEAELRQVSGIVERETAKDMIERYSPGAKRITVGADKGFDTADF